MMSDLDLELNFCRAGLGAYKGLTFPEFYPTKIFDFEEEINPGLGSLKHSTVKK